MENFLLAIIYILIVLVLHFYFVLGQSDFSQLFEPQLPPPLPISKPIVIPEIPIENPKETYSEYKQSLMNIFDEEVKSKPYTDPLKVTNPDFDELDAYYNKLSNDKYTFDPVPTSTTNDFKTDLLNDAKGNLNPEIVYGNIMAFEDFDSNFASL